MTTLTKFPLFPRLPIALRLRIYAFSLLYPRILHLRTPYFPASIRYTPSPHPALSALGLCYSDISWTTFTPPPPLLSVSHEAREVALSNYTLKFALLEAGPEIIYLNPVRDTIFAHMPPTWAWVLKLLLEDLRAFDGEHMGRGIRRLIISHQMLREYRADMFQGLGEVVVIVQGARRWEAEEVEKVFLAVPERNDEVMRAEQDVMDWKATQGARFPDGVKLSTMAWKRKDDERSHYLEKRKVEMLSSQLQQTQAPKTRHTT